jgi:hypothetical protein
MKTDKRRLVILSAISALAVLAVFAGLFAQIEQPVPVTQLEVTLSSLPLGVTAAEADEHLGSYPDAITESRGVLMSPVTMLTPENELAAKFGPPRDFTLRRWNRDGVSAFVAVDENGKVAARWSGRTNETN